MDRSEPDPSTDKDDGAAGATGDDADWHPARKLAFRFACI